MQQKSNEEIADLFIKLNQEKVKDFSKEYITKVIEQVKERAVFTKDIWDLSDYYFTNPTSYDEKASKKQWKPDTKDIMLEVKEIIKKIEDFKSIEIENKVKAYLTEKELGFGKVMPPLRLCIVGEMKGPHLFDIIEMIGKENTIKRIENVIEKLG